ncbi:MAG: cytochrome c oxidase subunit II [Acidobacteriota bacterium]|nr:MAG: cytochrome c oxidase subunit II [Acidobacteriota bacterium]
MFSNFQIFPEVASSMASKVDAFYFFMIGVSLFFFTLVVLLVTVFAIKFRRKSEDETPKPILGSLKLELIWTIIPFILSMVMFAWGAVLYFDMYTPPADAMNIYVVGKQWMWKIQHPEGNREINELHVPLGTPVKLIMTSEDVIHSFFVPAFRMKMDVVPGRYTTAWFEATKTGEYHLFCAEYCGTEHSEMIGTVYVMEPGDYQDWLERSAVASKSMAEEGAELYSQLGCNTCHEQETGARGPSLVGIHDRQVQLMTGELVKADDSYLRESILSPVSKVVAGFAPIMPTYKGQVSEEDVLKLIAYIQSLSYETAPSDIEATESERTE